MSTDNRRMTDRDGVEWMPTSEARRLIAKVERERDEARALIDEANNQISAGRLRTIPTPWRADG